MEEEERELKQKKKEEEIENRAAPTCHGRSAGEEIDGRQTGGRENGILKSMSAERGTRMSLDKGCLRVRRLAERQPMKKKSILQARECPIGWEKGRCRDSCRAKRPQGLEAEMGKSRES